MTDFIITHWPELLAGWFVASVIGAIMLGKALKALSRDWHEAERSGQ